jgi:hypothetical protein
MTNHGFVSFSQDMLENTSWSPYVVNYMKKYILKLPLKDIIKYSLIYASFK